MEQRDELGECGQRKLWRGEEKATLVGCFLLNGWGKLGRRPPEEMKKLSRSSQLHTWSCALADELDQWSPCGGSLPESSSNLHCVWKLFVLRTRGR
jgi:hypothetical protein